MRPDRLVPFRDVVFDPDADCFIAEGNAPQLLWTCPRHRRDLERQGAVAVTLTAKTLDGALNPVVYADWGDGFSEETRRVLSPLPGGLYRGVLHSNAGALRRLRLQPSDEPCRFTVGAFTVEAAAGGSNVTVRLSPPRRWARGALRRLQPGRQAALRRLWHGVRALAPGGGGRFSALRPGGWRKAYGQALAVAQNLKSPDFAAPPLSPPRRAPGAPRVLAFYLPQFHPIPENDAWWGRGFTEWSNVAKATPQFEGHLQPKLPADLGFYDLRVPEVRRKQVELARNVGVDGFCFHYYWFAGKRLLEGPLDAFAADEALDFPFALCWANENWTRRWDGREGELLIGQQHSAEDDLAVIDDLARYMASPRYIRVDGRPLILIYRPDALPDAAATLGRWRERAREIGLGPLFIGATTAFGFEDFEAQGFDALVEFPPHALAPGEITAAVKVLNPGFSGRVFDYPTLVGMQATALRGPRNPRRLPGIMPGWDNEARKPGAGHVFHNATPPLFNRWAAEALATAAKAEAPGLVFVNAWNEWAEGAYLEPDRWFGHAFGQALRAAIEAGAPRLAHSRADCVRPEGGVRAEAVVLLHLHYPDMIDDFAARLSSLARLLDVAVSFPDHWTQAEYAALEAAFPTARLTPYPNRGRDMAPFVSELRWAAAEGYGVFCKLHGKRSPHRADGAAWRDALVSPLLAHAAEAIARFRREPTLGLLGDAEARMTLGAPDVMHHNTAAVRALAKRIGFRTSARTAFAAGSMFWGRTSAFAPLLEAGELPFEPELGRVDGTLAHAMERLMAAITARAGYRDAWDLAPEN